MSPSGRHTGDLPGRVNRTDRRETYVGKEERETVIGVRRKRVDCFYLERREVVDGLPRQIEKRQVSPVTSDKGLLRTGTGSRERTHLLTGGDHTTESYSDTLHFPTWLGALPGSGSYPVVDDGVGRVTKGYSTVESPS